MPVTIREITGQLKIEQLVERSENRHREREYKRKRFSERFTALIPVGVVLAWLVAYSLSAPHTASLFIRITPNVIDGVNLAGLSPVVIEGFVMVISALLTYGISSRSLRISLVLMLVALMALSVGINVIGGIVTITSQAPITTSPFEVLWQGASIPAGVIVSFLSMTTGTVLIQFARGDIKLEITHGDTWRGVVRYNAIYQTFYEESIRLGATPSQAENIARNNAQRICTDVTLDEGVVIAVGAPASMGNDSLVGAVARHDATKRHDAHDVMGFHRYQNMNHHEPSKPLIRNNDGRDLPNDATNYYTVKNKAEFIQGEVSKRQLMGTAGEIAYELFGEDAPAIRRTVQRALKDLT